MANMGAVAWEAFAGIASAPVTTTLEGRVQSMEPIEIELVCFAPEDSWRIEDDRHRIRYVANEVGHYTWQPGGGATGCFQPRRANFFTSGGTVSPSLIRPRNLIAPIDDDFSRPLGPVEEVEFLGRRAWRALLAPPARKPSPVWQILDVSSGVTLAYQDLANVSIIEFTAIATGIRLSECTFQEPW